MQGYLAVRQKVCAIVDESVEIGPYPADPSQSDALCKAVARDIPNCSDAIAVLEEVLQSRGARLVEAANGQWGWSGIRVSSDVLAP